MLKAVILIGGPLKGMRFDCLLNVILRKRIGFIFDLRKNRSNRFVFICTCMCCAGNVVLKAARRKNQVSLIVPMKYDKTKSIWMVLKHCKVIMSTLQN
jgi:hypothetical protein